MSGARENGAAKAARSDEERREGAREAARFDEERREVAGW